VKVVIPAINVSAEVQHVGIGKSGRMAVPTNYADVGWYKYGTVPGRAGNAVVAGHVDNGFGLSGVFNRLSELDKDDEIIVEDRQGQRLVFRVVETRTFDSATEDTEEIFGPSERARLHLITCEGEWIPEKKTYSDRRVVTAQFEKIINTP
jgi:LPXTG-site transpeptidase (sortase) family protein